MILAIKSINKFLIFILKVISVPIFFGLTNVMLVYTAGSSSLLADTTSTKYFPLRVGNSWTYNGHMSSFYYRFKLVVSDSILQNNHIYYRINRYGYNPGFIAAYRVDSVLGRLLISTTSGCSWTPGEEIKDSLSAGLNDSLMISCYMKGVCNSITTVNLFGNMRQSIQHRYFQFSPPQSRQITWRYAYGIGQYYYYEDYFTTLAFDLIGCVINGVMYGDTSLTPQVPISNKVPEKFELYQNCPNPFNPMTKIRYDIPADVKRQTSNVKLIIFDVMGRELATLVNEQLKPGTYEVEFDGGNYASGVYFYSLITNEFTQTKKLILLK